MKKLLLTITLFGLGFIILKGQDFTVQAGLNIAQGNYTLASTELSTAPHYGFNAGITGDFKVFGPLYINGGVMYEQKGTYFEFLDQGGDFLIDFIEVPLNIKAKLKLGPIGLFAQAGPYVAYSLSNKIKYDNSSIDDYVFEYGNGNDQMKRYDFGFNVGGGIEFSSFKLIFNYGEGFKNEYEFISELTPALSSTYKNKVISISLGFKF
jgi:hypothetical protein